MKRRLEHPPTISARTGRTPTMQQANRTWKWVTVALLVVSYFCALPAQAHKPIENDGTHLSPETALVIDDPDVSHVVYHILPDGASQLWIAIEMSEATDQFVQLGVPYIESLDGYRPALAVVGPGLPDVSLPFSIPPGAGGIILDPTEPPDVFDEEFTGTTSWILIEETLALPSDGTYYIVAYHPEEIGGKLWVAVGTKEEFGFVDFATFPGVIEQVREFHEVSDEPMPTFTRIIYAATRVLRFVLSIFGKAPENPVLF